MLIWFFDYMLQFNMADQVLQVYIHIGVRMHQPKDWKLFRQLSTSSLSWMRLVVQC